MTHLRLRSLSKTFAIAPVCLVTAWLCRLPLLADELPSNDTFETSEVLFVQLIGPILREKCVACHGADPQLIEGGLDLTADTALHVPGDSGDNVVIPGNALSSPLYLAVNRKAGPWSPMPPKDAEALSEVQVEQIKAWIQSGAAWPDARRQAEIAAAHDDEWSVQDGVQVSTSGGLSEDWTNRRYEAAGLWAYRPVIKPASSNLDNASQHPIDALIERQLPDGLALAPRTDRRSLIRRAAFDLLGLPPTTAQIQQFLDDPRPDREAFADVVDQFLQSPHYGERMAQQWLDVVRYADSSGFANDYERGNAWRYRDYVIRAFNNDKPYDQFIREQIAGDEIDSDDPEMLVATGFLRMGPWELTGMEVAKVARQRFLDDVTNSVGETFLAHSLQCARCHDHKFDPIPTRDYYSLQAVFATTQLTEREAPFLVVENQTGFDERRYLQQTSETHRQTLEELDAVLLANAEQWYADQRLDPTPWREALARIADVSEGTAKSVKASRRQSVFNAVRNSLQKQGLAEEAYPPKLVGFTPEQFGLERIARKGLERLRWELERYEPYALAVYSGKTPDVNSVLAPVRLPTQPLKLGELERTCILTGGDPFAAGAPVTPGALSVLADQLSVSIPDSVIGRRKAVAEWIASPNNPLTTRAIVNRLWGWHFGRGLAGNPNNFGSTGKRPTHPELLDWLAATMIESGWSMKAMHRKIMNSEAYCRAATHPDPSQLATLDPNGDHYAVFHPRRLTAEELRDAMLLASGELNRTLGGIPVRPEINLEAALQPRQVMGTFAAAWTPNPLPEQRHRRSIYTLKLRGLVDPLMEVFNAPSSDFSCERREASTVTPQVFSLFNGHNTHARALALAARVCQTGSDDAECVVRCFELVYGRSATPAEIELCRDHWQQTLDSSSEEAAPLVQLPTEILRQAIEENTGERFSFTEQLFANRDFVPDLQPHQVDRRTRALAEVCLVLLNSNEFVYVY